MSLWYDSTWDWTLVSWAIGEHSNHYAKCWVKLKLRSNTMKKKKDPCKIRQKLKRSKQFVSDDARSISNWSYKLSLSLSLSLSHTHTHTRIHISAVGWSCRIHRLYHCREVPTLNKCPRYGIKQPDGEAPALEIWGMWSTSLLPLLKGPFCPGVVVPDRVPFMDRIEQTLSKQMSVLKLWLLNSNTWNHLIVQKRAQARLRILPQKICLQIKYILYICINKI